MAALFLSCGIAPGGIAQNIATERVGPITGLLSNKAIVYNPATRKIYAVDTRRGQVTVIDTISQDRKNVTVDDAPVAIAINSITNKIYVANNGSGSISVLDGATDSVTATIAIGKTPYVLAVNEITNKIYVSNTFSDVVHVIDGRTNTVHTLKAGSADKIVVDTKRDLIYLLGYEANYLSVIDGATEDVRHQPVGAIHLWDVTLNNSTGKAFVTRIGSGDTVAIGATLEVIRTGDMPCAVRIDAQRQRGYVANYASNSVTIFNTTNYSPIATITVGERPQAIALDKEANLVYVANTHSNSISVIDGARLKVVATLPTGQDPYAVVFDPQNNGVYAADLSEQGVTHIDVGHLRAAAMANPAR